MSRAEQSRIEYQFAEALYQYLLSRRRFTNYIRKHNKPPDRMRITKTVWVIVMQKYDSEGRLR